MLRTWLATAVVLALAGPAGAQSLADAATKEKQRRAEQEKAASKDGKAGQSFTNDDLGKAKGTVSTGSPDASKASPPPTTDRREEGRDADRPKRSERRDGAGPPPEQEWSAQARAARAAVAAAQGAVSKADEQFQAVNGRMLLSTDTYELQRLKQQRDSLQRELNDAKADLAQAQARLADFEERARRAGIPPGWIREQ